MKAIRFISILIVGLLLINITYNSQFEVSLADGLSWFVLIFIGICLLIWTLVTDIKRYRFEKKVSSFGFTVLCLLIFAIVSLLEVKSQGVFNQTTLLKVFYDGDFNGVGIDFKKNGTYIFDNSSIGSSNYTYGTYQISGDSITLDRNKIGNVSGLKHLVIKPKSNPDSSKTDMYLFSINEKGDMLAHSLVFRITVDNRE